MRFIKSFGLARKLEDLAPAGVAPKDFHVACVVELTRRRALDMR